MAQGGFKSFPFGYFTLLGLGGGTINPISPFASSPSRKSQVISGLDVRGEAQRLRIDAPGANSPKEIRVILAKVLDAIQANADIQDQRFRSLAENLNSIGLVKDPAGNIAFSGATFTVRAGTEQFTLALGGMLFGVPNNAPDDALIPLSHGTFYLDEVGNALKFRVRYSDGTLKTGTIALI